MSEEAWCKFCETPVDTTADPMCECDGATIERLRLENENLKSHAIAQNDYRIKLTARTRQLRERVKELEAHYNEQICLKCMHAPGIFITDLQIDASMELIADTTKWPSSILDLLWALLNEVGIFQCEGCGGSGLVPAWTAKELSYCNDLSRMHEEQDDCPGCNGKKYVIGNEQDDAKRE